MLIFLFLNIDYIENQLFAMIIKFLIPSLSQLEKSIVVYTYIILFLNCCSFNFIYLHFMLHKLFKFTTQTFIE